MDRQMERLTEILRATTLPLQRAEPPFTKKVKGISVHKSYYSDPDLSMLGEGYQFEIVTFPFMGIGVNREIARAHEAELRQILKRWPKKALGAPVPSLSKGPDFIQAGIVLENTNMGLCLFALGKVLGFWDIEITPVDLRRSADHIMFMAQKGNIRIKNCRLR